jgi:hypothetical protein
MPNDDNYNNLERDPREGKLEIDPSHDFEIKIERKKQKFETVEEASAKSDNLFWIVVKSLAEKGHDLPNQKIIEIKPMGVGTTYQNMRDDVVIKFKDGVWLIFNTEDSSVIAMIKGESTKLDEYDAKRYREKYLNYAERFLDEKDNILSSKSDLAAEKLNRLGI